jgi:hypothetical protein
MADWCHDMLDVLAATEDDVDVTAGVCSVEHKQRGMRRLKDKLGVRLGVGPMP